jgi:hypothetical protein
MGIKARVHSWLREVTTKDARRDDLLARAAIRKPGRGEFWGQVLYHYRALADELQSGGVDSDCS